MQRPGSSCRMVCDANERTVGLIGVNTHDQQVCPLRQCRDGNPPRRNQGCIRPVSFPPVRRDWCLGPGRVSNNDLPPAFGAAPQPAGDRCHQGTPEDRHLPNKFDYQTLGHGRPRDCYRPSQPLSHSVTTHYSACIAELTSMGSRRRLRRRAHRLVARWSPGRTTGPTTLRAALRAVLGRGPVARPASPAAAPPQPTRPRTDDVQPLPGHNQRLWWPAGGSPSPHKSPGSFYAAPAASRAPMASLTRWRKRHP
jgi:hypothetical protein